MTDNKGESDKKSLLDSAVVFLQDESVINAPLDEKINFLRKKGLDDNEIELALEQARVPKNKQDGPKGKAITSKHVVEQPAEYTYEALPPLLPQRDWRDYFIMATASCGVLYGLYEVARRYVMPTVLPDSVSKLEQDKQEIDAQFLKVDKVLEALEQRYSELKESEEQKIKELDIVIAELQEAIAKTSRIGEKLENDIEVLKLRITTLQSSVEGKLSGDGAVTELQSIERELKSLKRLMEPHCDDPESRTEGGNDNRLVSQQNRLPGVNDIPSAVDLLAELNIEDDKQ